MFFFDWGHVNTQNSLLPFWAHVDNTLAPSLNSFQILKLIVRSIIIIDHNSIVMENFIYHVGKIDDDKTRNQGGGEINETSSFLYLHPLDHVQFDPKTYAQTLVNTYNVSPVLCNFQKGFDESNANCRLVSLPPKKRCLRNKLLTDKKSDPEARYQILKKARQNIFIPKIKKKNT